MSWLAPMRSSASEDAAAPLDFWGSSLRELRCHKTQAGRGRSQALYGFSSLFLVLSRHATLAVRHSQN